MRTVARAPDAGSDPAVRPLAELPFEEVMEFDSAHFGVPRARFLRQWIAPRGGLGLGLVKNGLQGMGVIRPAADGFKVGPLFAPDDATAERILRGLIGIAADKPILLDVPERNAEAMELAARFEMEEVFGCARMYLGEPPPTPWDRIFGVTTFELG